MLIYWNEKWLIKLSHQKNDEVSKVLKTYWKQLINKQNDNK